MKAQHDGRQSIGRSPRDLILFAEAVMAVTVASLVLKLPFRWVVKSMAIGRESTRLNADTGPSVAQAVKRASRRLPWRTVCFHQGLATHWMLRLRGVPSVLHYGIRTGDELAAHVWVTVNGEILIGEAEAGRHACVATFPDPDR